MKQVSYNDKLQKEKEKLGQLVDEAKENGIPLAQDKAVMAQSRKVDALIGRILKEKARQRKSRQER